MMNDFTKEELVAIKKIYDKLTVGTYIENLSSLMIKVDSMIDNYCEHEYKKTLDKSGMAFINMCHKCKDTKSWSLSDMQSEYNP